MFKAARWRSEKNRIKAVFKLQFQATQMPQLGWETMVVTLVPLEVGKPTGRSEKAAVIEGACNWPNPVYETVKLTQDPKTGKINNKVYQFLVSATGSAKSGVLGETNVNLADYAQIFKPSSVSLPLKESDGGAILHVTIQRIRGEVEARENDENEVSNVERQRKTLRSQLSIAENERGHKVANDTNSTNEAAYINSQAQVKFHSSRNIPLQADSSSYLRKSSSFDAISVSGSESSSGLCTPRENGIEHNNTHQDTTSLLSPLSNSDTPRNPATSSGTDWSVSSAPDGSIGGSTNSSGETGLQERMQESDDTLEKQKSDIVALARQLEVSELELQTLRKQVVKENRRGQDLSRELSSLKEERDALRRVCEELKASEKSIIHDENVATKLQFGGKDLWSILEETKQELNHEKNLNANFRLQLQKTQESNSELILAVRDLEEMLEEKNREISFIDKGSQEMKFEGHLSHLENSELNPQAFEATCKHDKEENYPLEVVVKEHDDAKVACSLQQRIIDLNSEVELYKKDREDLEMQMEQLALDYEILKQENHDISSRLEQMQLREQLRMQYECSAHLTIISDLEADVENLEKELAEQTEAFETDLASITHAKVEQEQRAIQAENSLTKTRWNNADIVGQLQEEFKRVSLHMSSRFNANEKLIMKTLAEATELRQQKCHLEHLLEKSNEVLSSVQHQHHLKCQQLLSLVEFKTNEADELHLELKKNREELENQKKSAEERQRVLTEEIFFLKSGMEKLSMENNNLSEQIEQKEKQVAEIEKLKILTKESEMLLQERNSERYKLERELSLIKEKANKAEEELNDLRLLIDERDTRIKYLNSEVENTRVQYNDLKNSLSANEFENENLREQVSLLTGHLRKEAHIIANAERKFKDDDTKPTVSDGTTDIRNKNEKSVLASPGSQEVPHLDEKSEIAKDNLFNMHDRDMHQDEQDISVGAKQFDIANSQMQEDSEINENSKSGNINSIRITTGYLQETRTRDKTYTAGSKQTSGELIIRAKSKKEQDSLVSCSCDQNKIAEVLNEMAELKEWNESMEAELKEMQERYSEMSLKFAEVEGERQQLVIKIRTLKNALKN